MRALALCLLGGLAACSSDMLGAELGVPPGACPDNSVTFSFGVEPSLIARDADVSVSVRWETYDSLREPVATLQVGLAPVVEVEVPLLPAGDGIAPFAYQGSMLNPFGLGAPVGTVEVLGGTTPVEGCIASPTAASAFELE